MPPVRYTSDPFFDLADLKDSIQYALIKHVEMILDRSQWILENTGKPHWKSNLKKQYNHMKRLFVYSEMADEFINIAQAYFKQKRVRACTILFRDLQVVKYRQKERGQIIYNTETDEKAFGKDRIKRVYHYYISLIFRKVRVKTTYGTIRTAFVVLVGPISTYGRKINAEYPIDKFCFKGTIESVVYYDKFLTEEEIKKLEQ